MTNARAPVTVLLVLVALLALTVQLASFALYGGAAVTPSLPHALQGEWPFALAARLGLDRWAPLRAELARGAIARNEPARAAALLAPLAPTATVLDLRGRTALLQGDTATALRDFADVGDFIAAQGAIAALGTGHPVEALAVVHDFELRLRARTVEPEILAEVDFTEGTLAATAAYRRPAQAEAYEQASEDAFGRALELAPNDEKYLLNYAYAALRLGDAEGALHTYQRAAQVVPDSADAFAGIALTQADLGNCTASRAALAQARTLHANAPKPLFVIGDYPPEVRAGYARCYP